MIHHLSPSTAKSYRTCGRQVLYEKIMKLPNTTSYASTIYGSAMHNAIEDLMNSKKAGSTLELPNFKQKFIDEYMATSHKTTAWGEDTPGHLIEQGELACEDFYRDILPMLNPMDVEKKFEIDRGKDKLPILSYADIVTDDGFVYDYKFGRGMWGSADSLDYMLNMSTYALGYELEHGVLPVVRIIKQKWSGSKQPSGKKKWSHKGFEIDQIKINDKTIEHYLGVYDEVEKGIKAGVFLPCEQQGLCKECAYRGNPCDVVLPQKFDVKKVA